MKGNDTIRSIFFIPLVFLCLGTLNSDQHIVFIRSDQYFFIAGFDSEKREVISWVQVPD